MKQTLTTSQIADQLYSDENAGWSYAGARALAEYLEEMEDDTGEEMEFDRVAIRCDWSEMETALEVAEEYGWEADDDLDPEELEESALDWLRDQTQVIEFDGGIIYCAW